MLEYKPGLLFLPGSRDPASNEIGTYLNWTGGIFSSMSVDQGGCVYTCYDSEHSKSVPHVLIYYMN